MGIDSVNPRSNASNAATHPSTHPPTHLLGGGLAAVAAPRRVVPHGFLHHGQGCRGRGASSSKDTQRGGGGRGVDNWFVAVQTVSIEQQ